MSGQLYTPICDMLGIEYPIFLAGMNSGGAGQSKSPTPVKLEGLSVEFEGFSVELNTKILKRRV